MSVIEFIGFIITMLALALLFMRRLKEEQEQKGEEEHEEKPSELLKELLGSLEHERVKQQAGLRKSSRPPPLPLESSGSTRPLRQSPAERAQGLAKSYRFQSKLEKRQLKSALEEYKPKTAIETRKLVSSIEKKYGVGGGVGAESISAYQLIEKDPDQAYSLERTIRISRAAKVVRQLRSKRDLMVCHEILSKPKGVG